MTYIDSQGKLLQHPGRLAELKETGRTSAPINVELDLSFRCSLGCQFCHMAFTHRRGPLAKGPKVEGQLDGGDLMSYDLACRVIDELAAGGVLSLTLSGGGEPTLCPDFDRVVEYAEGKLALGIYTHGGHISAARAAIMKRAMTWVYVSLDAADRETYRRYKQVDRFNAACRGIENLANAKGDATVGVGFLITADNWERAEEGVDLARALGADYIQFRPMVHYEDGSPDSPAEETDWLAEPIQLLRMLADENPEFVIADTERFRMYQGWQGHPYGTCWWSALQTIISPDGQVWVCANRRLHPGASLGSLAEESFSEIWGRHRPCQVGPDCRVMCRGHISNLALDEIMKSRPHAEFV